MANGDLIVYNLAAFICALFVLDYGADQFVDHTAIVAKRTGVPQTLIALLTAGAEWEELAVVVFCIIRHRPSLALGNIVGSAISNILGAFSLGLIFFGQQDGSTSFDRTAKLYTVLQLAITVLTSCLLLFGQNLKQKLTGALLVAVFAVYVISVLLAIRFGYSAAVKTSHDRSSNTSEAGDDTTGGAEANDISPFGRAYGTFTSRNEATANLDVERPPKFTGNPLRPSSFSPSPRSGSLDGDRRLSSQIASQHAAEPLLSGSSGSSFSDMSEHSLLYHLACLVAGFIVLTLSAFVLSHASSTLATELGLSDVLFGIVILSIATTLPEKLVSIISGARGHSGILVASAAGSNIFLLTLCMGVVMISVNGDFQRRVSEIEVGLMLASSLLMTAVVCMGSISTANFTDRTFSNTEPDSYHSTTNAEFPMNWFRVLLVLLLCFLILVLVFFALSSCLGDEIRAAWSGRSTSVVPTTYGMQYARMMGQSGQHAGWEQIEMEDMLDERVRRRQSDD
ncbi:hypothetical protein LTR27_002855 [Elasticomyces elasticus]|nr:hypothetical protein LTR27_002855 [Elasticomyces elasticus]